MILAYINRVAESQRLIEAARNLSQCLKKNWGILFFTSTQEQEDEGRKLQVAFEKSGAKIFLRKGGPSDLLDFCETEEVALLLLQLSDNRYKTLQTQLNACRNLRIPYLFFKNSFPELHLKKILIPVTFLEEEVEKAHFASAFGRFCQSRITLLQARDYGSKAASNVEKMKTLFDKFDLDFGVEQAEKDSFKVESEAIRKAEEEAFDLLMISASRDYGLDDILFGPKENKFVRQSKVPILLINPRGDLYALCD